MTLSKFIRWALVPIGVFGLQALAVAETTNQNSALPLPDTGVSVLRVLGALILVLAIFFGAVWLFKNSQRAFGRSKGNSQLHVLEAKSLGNRQTVYVVGYGRQRMLLGSSPTGIALVSQLPEATEVEQAAGPSGASFVDALQSVLNRK
jgi:flagellar protein FliO/FliZ